MLNSQTLCFEWLRSKKGKIKPSTYDKYDMIYFNTYVVDEKGLDDAVGIELVTTYTNAEGKEHIYSVEPMEVIKKEGNLYTFQCKHSLSNSGSFKVAYRMYPKNVDLPHRQDFCYVRWFV